MNFDPMHVMRRVEFERQAAREVDARIVACALLNPQAYIIAKMPEPAQPKPMPKPRASEPPARPVADSPAPAMASLTNDEIRRQLGPTGKERTR